jgi:hypothetical protein
LSSLLTASLFAIHPIHTEAGTTRHFQTVCIVYKIPILLACADIFSGGSLMDLRHPKSQINQQDYYIPFQTVLVSRLSTWDESDNWNDLRGFQWWHFQYYYYTHWLSEKEAFETKGHSRKRWRLSSSENGNSNQCPVSPPFN